MDQKNKFKELNQNAFAIFTKLFSEDASANSEIEELSRKSFEIAQRWDELEEKRLEVFYSNKENRKNWINPKYPDSPLNNVNDTDVYISRSEYGNQYWVVPMSIDDTPILATFLEIDDNNFIFTKDKIQKFKIKSILLNNN